MLVGAPAGEVGAHGIDAPAWRDPRFLSPLKLRQLEEHEQAIRDRERARERRRLLALLVKPEDEWVEDEEFPGCVW